MLKNMTSKDTIRREHCEQSQCETLYTIISSQRPGSTYSVTETSLQKKRLLPSRQNGRNINFGQN